MINNLRIGNQVVAGIYLGNTLIRKMYNGNLVVYDTNGQTPCFEVVSSIVYASGQYVDVYCTDDSKWYKKNNLSQYEEYGIYEKTSNLSSTTYYTGKLVMLNSDKHEYRWDGSEWTDVGRVENVYDGYTIYENLQITSNYSGANYHFDTGYTLSANTSKIWTKIYTVSSSTRDDYSLCTFKSNCGVKIESSKIAYYWNQGTYNKNWINYNSNKIVETEFDISNKKITCDGTSVSLTGSPTPDTGYTYKLFQDPRYGSMEVKSGTKFYGCKIWDSGTLVADLKPAIRKSDSAKGIYDPIRNTFIRSYNNLMSYNMNNEQSPYYPVEYDTKVAPADNVHYDTLAELELMECPWVGMYATIGSDNTPYTYTENGWEPFVIMNKWFTIESLSDNNEISMICSSTGATPVTISVSTDGQTWTSKTTDTSGVSLATLNTGEKLYIKGNNAAYGSSKDLNNYFASTGTFKVKGYIMSLIYGDDFYPNRATLTSPWTFVFLFKDCTYLTDASELLLTATTLQDSCYREMFNGCSSLTAVPALPATTLVDNCYRAMFVNCTSLTTAPVLPATTLATYCYSYMFQYCSALVNAPVLPATTLATYCYYYMFMNCTSLTTAPNLPATALAEYCYAYMFYSCGNLTTPPVLPATTLAEYCYSYMFYSCGNFTTPPVLPATTLVSNCYSNMFRNCSSLTSDHIPELPATSLANGCYNSMFRGCTSLTTCPELPATSLAAGCYNSMFYGCTGITESPVLPATSLATTCYAKMFYNCSALNKVTALFTTTPGSTNTGSWLSGVAASGTFYKSSSATWSGSITRGESTVPSGWTITNYTS